MQDKTRHCNPGGSVKQSFLVGNTGNLRSPPNPRRNVYVPPFLVPSLPADLFKAEYTQNPFASTHSLDTNPFDDPPTKDAPHPQDLDRRERDLERREQELNQRAEHIRKHGRNNWPPCLYPSPLARSVLMYSSFPSHLPLHFRRDPGRFPSPHLPSLSTMARPCRYPPHKHACLHIRPRCRRE